MQSAAKPMSFQQILDEELARKLAEEDNEPLPLPQVEHEANSDKQSQELADYLLALKLSQQGANEYFSEDEENIEENLNFENEENQKNIEENQNKIETDDDYILALRLQTEYEMEEDRELRMKLDREKGTSKVSICYDNLLQTHPAYFQNEKYAKKNLPAVAETGEDFSVAGSKKKATKPKGRVSLGVYNKTNKEPAHPLTKPQNKEKQTVEIITKHDPEAASLKNINRIEGSSNINSGDLLDTGITLHTPVFNNLLHESAHISHRQASKQGKEDRETHDRVLDTQTRLLLFKLINSGTFSRLEGIINSGKEANVYKGVIPNTEDQFYAVKIFKTTLTEFKNREIYIKDDFRFRYRCHKQSSSKFISVWAEKEMDNLIRIQKAGINCPNVILQKKNILVLSFLGVADQAAPQLRHVHLSASKFAELYRSCIQDIRKIFQKARLVHADLSEYNLLYHNHALYFIDVAQSVEIQHPYALYFLRRDCNSINSFFKKRNVVVLSNCELFNYVTDTTINDDNEAAYLESIFELCSTRTELSLEQQINEQVFMQSFIPQELNQITDPISEIERAMDGNTSDIFHRAFTGVNEDFSGIRTVPDILQDVLELTSSEEEDDESLDSTDENDSKPTNPAQASLSKEEQRKIRKQAKKEFKLKQRENRQMKQTSKK